MGCASSCKQRCPCLPQHWVHLLLVCGTICHHGRSRGKSTSADCARTFSYFYICRAYGFTIVLPAIASMTSLCTGVRTSCLLANLPIAIARALSPHIQWVFACIAARFWEAINSLPSRRGIAQRRD